MAFRLVVALELLPRTRANRRDLLMLSSPLMHNWHERSKKVCTYVVYGHKGRWKHQRRYSPWPVLFGQSLWLSKNNARPSSAASIMHTRIGIQRQRISR
ncbi:hypothetical protein FOMPIDRAFT_1025553 [Fomitopsis schrenkii]|uniref:Uncharacterized protein n=1 Tax=Fomitopsis schrenkii TaxID=2126942 RepID=S8FBP5_FOMSC|nr:hypothetical protein FOMPIDRAFT_1025553 [Fomitopsis schrenkii]